ncbi:immunoglobulin superfamily member 10 [Sceloporus undulatus]|uniref:immunoglobulin superfamily member 10 n=1 Tax=Sceloporus undulatus TaxID=8520 RepID=UPI001C4DB7AB|nr:immunoglobulin superfamily member 10 [Sceloporus undulatus]
MKRKGKSNPCLLQLLFGFCMAAFSGSSACPKPCACYVPTEVHCTFRYLSTIPPHIPRNVERINLGYNSLVKLTERDFSGLEKLELLMLHSNQIHTVQDRTFSDLHLLQVLKMSYNKVKVVHADTFHGLTGLVRLHMDHNQIEFINPNAFYGLTSLKLVHLEGNVLKQLHPNTFVTLCYLQIFKTSSIKHIYLSDNLFTSLPQDIFTYMSDLERLYLHGNPWICDCSMKWFAKWTEQNPDVVKCKTDRGSSGVLQCPLCSNPRTSKDKQLADLSLSDYNCIKPTIDTTLKTKNITVPDDGDFISISPKDFMAPIGSVVLNMTDQAQNRASLACSVQNPSKISPVSFQKMDNITVLKSSLLTFLVCSIEYEHIQQLWSILALYSNSPLKLKREQLLKEAPYLSYKYKQTDSENEDLFTDIDAELRAEPPWLMQEQISLQLDRTASTLNTLHIQYAMDVQITLPVAGPKSAGQRWAMIFQRNSTRTEYSVLAGRSVELDCQAIGDPTPVIEWVLADGSKIKAPYVSEDGRMMIAKSGNLLLRAADSFDTGVYHCIGTNYEDADVLTFRIIVIDPYMEHNHFNGPQLSVLLNEAVYLPCQSTATPDASVDWILPEHIILNNSSKNKLLFQNDTLKIQQTTDRDGGYIKCIAANQYGADFLVYQIVVKRLENSSQELDIQVEDEAAEGSGEKPEVIRKPQTPLQTEVTHQGFTKGSSIKHPILNKAKNNYKVIYRRNRDKISKRYRGRKRQFAPSTRRIDPLRWAAFLEKTKKNATLLTTQEHARVKPTVKGLLSSKIFGNQEETSGDDMFPEEEFMLLPTKRPALYTLREASGNVVTAELGSVSSNYSSLATSGMVPEIETPVTSPVIMLTEEPNSQEIYMEVKHETERESFEEYLTLHIPPTYTEPSTTTSSKLPSNVANVSGTFHKLIPSEENILHLKMTPTVTTATNVNKESQSVTAEKNTVKTHLFAEANEEASRKPNNQVSVVTISASDDIFRHIYVYSTPKITTPKPLSVSTITTHQQFKRVRDVTTHTPLYRQYGKRKKISSRRRIVRPDCIPKLSSRRFPFVRPRQQESTCMPPLVEVSASTLSPPYKFYEQTTSQAPLPSSFKSQHADATTFNQILTFSGNKLDTGEQYTTSKIITFYPENSQVVSQREVESITPLQTITDRNPSFITDLQTQTIYSPGDDKETESTKASISPSTIKSTIPTLETNTSSSDSAGGNSWHNLFGRSHVQRELLEKQPSLQTKPSTTLQKGVESLPVVSVIPGQTTVPIDSISPVYKSDFSKNRSQTDGPTLPLNVTELPSSAHSSSLTSFLKKERNATSMVPVPILITAAKIENKISRPRMFGPGRRRGQRRRRPLKMFMQSQENVSSNKGITTLLEKRMSSTTLEMSKKVTVSSSTIQTELFSALTDMDVVTARIQQPIASTELIFEDNKPTTAAQILERNTTTKYITATNIPVDHLSSEKPVPQISLPVSFLDVVSTTTVLPDTSLTTLRLLSNKPTQATTVINKELYQHLERKVVQGKKTTEAVLPIKTELNVLIPTDSVHPTTQDPNPLTSQSGVITGVAIAETTISPKWEKSPWNEPSSKTAESRKPFIINMLTILKSQSSTQYSPLKRKNNYVKSWSEKIPDQESTTTNLIALNSFYQTRVSKPRIIGGKFAAFTVLANSDAFIPCEASGNPEPTIQWTKASSSVDAPKHKHDNKLEILPNGTLSIQNVNVQDRGQYICTAANQYGSDKLLVTLSVVTYPPRILGRRSRIITVHSGKSVTMKCTAEGRPIPTISWILANKTYISESSIGNEAISFQTDGTLTIKKASIYDRGIYTCTAYNPAGSDTVTIKLQVIAAPPIILEEKKQYVLENKGESLMLPCTVKGNPHPGVHWVLFDGTEVKPLQYINGKLFLFPNGTLYIRNIAPSDSGNYECIATSSTGSERRVVNLQVEHGDTTPRIAVASQRLTQLNFGDRLLLNCSATGEPDPKIIWRLPSKAVVDQWHRMGSRIHVYPNGSLAVKAVTEKDEGDYICVARNKMGDDLILMKVSVTMKPAKIDEKHYFKKLVPYGKDFKVDCKASGSPEPEISWSLPDGTMINNVMQADDSGHRSRRYILFDNGTLYFNKIGVAEEGDYTCYAQNTLGKDEMKVHITVVATAPRIKHNSKTYVKIKAGDSAIFDCDATGEPKPKIFWLLPSSDMISASTQRYFLHVNGSLSVTKVRLIDAGEYICVARNSGGDDTKLYKLDVVSKPPLINGLYTNKTVIKITAIKHSKKHIDCKAQGTPVPQIMWIMPDNIFLTAPYYGSRITVHKNGTLEIRNVRPSDSAEFICVARNDGGESILVVQLEVLEMLRRPVFRNPFNEKVIAKPGKIIFLNCSVDGNPPPEIIWMLPNGTRLSPGFRTHHYFLGSNGTLVINSPSKADVGKYRCAAKNKVGYIEKLIVLEVGQKPTIFIHSRGVIKSTSGESLSLHCLAGGSPKPNIIWTVPSGYVLDHPQINGKYTLLENGTLFIRETTDNDRGSYTCKAQNYVGESTVVVFVMTVAHPPRITNRPPRSIHTIAGVALQLHCMALGVPSPEITWELPDHSLLSTGSKSQPSGNELLHPQGTLVIQNPKSSDSGIYKCMAKNQLGTDSTVTYVQVI